MQKEEEVAKQLKESLIALIEKDEINKHAEFKKRLNIQRLESEIAQANADLAKADVIKDPSSGQEIKAWDYVLRLANHAISPEQNAYNDWRSAVMYLLNMYINLSTAITASIKQNLGPYVLPYLYALKYKTVVLLKDYLLDQINAKTELNIPKLLPEFKFDKDGKLQKPILSFEGKEIKFEDEKMQQEKEKLNQAFSTLVDLWLFENGYEKRPNGRYFDVNGKELNKADFETLNTNQQTSLDGFLKRSTGDELNFGSVKTIDPEPIPSMNPVPNS